MALSLSVGEIATVQAEWAKHGDANDLMGKVLVQSFEDDASLRHTFPFMKGHEEAAMSAIEELDGFKAHQKELADFFSSAIASLGEDTQQKFIDLGKFHATKNVTAHQLISMTAAMLKVLAAEGASMDAWRHFGEYLWRDMVHGLQA